MASTGVTAIEAIKCDSNKGLTKEWTYSKVIVYICDRCGCDFNRVMWNVCVNCWRRCDLCKLYHAKEEVEAYPHNILEGDYFCKTCTRLLSEGEKVNTPLH